jgi:hypothetical protein
MEELLQNRYVGDVGDYAKYGLLRMLTGTTGFRWGVIWCLYDDESHNDDGRHVGYLKDPIMCGLDPDLHRHLSGIVSSGRRSVKWIARKKILPGGTTFFEWPISIPANAKASRVDRSIHRSSWLRKALSATSDCDLVFFDPDNGLETKSVPLHSQKSGKYIFWDELAPFWERGQSLLIYHHLNRTAPIDRQAEVLKQKFSTRFGNAAIIQYFLFRRGSCRHFWLVANEHHAARLAARTEALLQSPWREYFAVG